MGASLTSIQETIPYTENRPREEILDYLEVLQELANTKAQLFHQQVISEENKRKHNLRDVKCLSTKLYASMKRDVNINQELIDAIEEFVGMEWINGGLRALFKRSLQNVLTGDGEKENRSSFIYNTDGDFHRIDYYIYKRDVKYGPVSKSTNNIVVVAFSIYSIDTSQNNSIETDEGVHEKPNMTDDLKEGPESVEGGKEGPESVEGIKEVPESEEGVKEGPESEEGLKEGPESEEGVKEGPESEEGVKEEPESEEGVKERLTSEHEENTGSAETTNEQLQAMEKLDEEPEEKVDRDERKEVTQPTEEITRGILQNEDNEKEVFEDSPTEEKAQEVSQQQNSRQG
uniref:Uncharacterized protein n=1 Tax=Clytia hemisphaerica TaxID=252671 RepID=A0A7M6DQN0_9CNID|eukprot:TCONS_00061955-protein